MKYAVVEHSHCKLIAGNDSTIEIMFHYLITVTVTKVGTAVRVSESLLVSKLI